MGGLEGVSGGRGGGMKLAVHGVDLILLHDYCLICVGSGSRKETFERSFLKVFFSAGALLRSPFSG